MAEDNEEEEICPQMAQMAADGRESRREGGTRMKTGAEIGLEQKKGLYPPMTPMDTDKIEFKLLFGSSSVSIGVIGG